MKKIILASACVLALSTGGAFAQTQPAPGASSSGNVGPGAVQDAKKDEMKMKKGMTTGTGRMDNNMGTSSAPSSSGNVGPGTNNNNNGPQPRGR
jgi:hypothetical protein